MHSLFASCGPGLSKLSSDRGIGMKYKTLSELISAPQGFAIGVILLVWSSLGFSQSADTAEAGRQPDTLATSLCESALISKEELFKKAREQGVSKRQLKNLECNDTPVLMFAEHNQQEDFVFGNRNLVNIE